MRIIIASILLLLISGCSSFPKIDTFQSQSCVVVYCEDSEHNKSKAAGLKLIEIIGASQGIDIKLGRGFCEQYYTKRDIDYRYTRKSAYDVCKGVE